MSEAESKFWETPELLETLFLLLDLESTLSLAGLMDQENLQHSMTSKVWSKLVSQNCPSVCNLDSDSLEAFAGM